MSAKLNIINTKWIYNMLKFFPLTKSKPSKFLMNSSIVPLISSNLTFKKLLATPPESTYIKNRLIHSIKSLLFAHQFPSKLSFSISQIFASPTTILNIANNLTTMKNTPLQTNHQNNQYKLSSKFVKATILSMKTIEFHFLRS